MRVERLGLAVYAWILIGALGCGDDGPGGGDLPVAGMAPQGGDGVIAGRGGAGSGGTAGVSGSGGSAGTAGASGTAGAAGAAGQSGAGAGAAGDGGPGPEDDAGSAANCVYQGAPLIDPQDLASCESATCQNAHCLPRSAVGSPELAERLADCDAQNECVPDLFIVTLGDFLLESCRSIDDAEGRCVSTCVPRVARQIDVLPQAGCADGERCAPCFDPFTGEESGACGQGCDPGPTEEPYLLPTCCGGLGVCVLTSIVPADQAELLGRDSCSDAERLCAPTQVAADPSAVPSACDSLLGVEGRCLPACLPAVAAQADRLPSLGCPADHLCAPCFDPVTGEATGACTLGDDHPVEQPFAFVECCGGRSVCVPVSLVPADQQELLDATGCQSGELCAPKDIAAGSYAPQSCSSWGGSEGRCLLACLPDVMADSDRLSRGVCDEGELCVPCFDPLTGESTGGCEIEDDMPAEPEPYVFPTCCDDGAGNDLGTCVPSALVPADQQALLGSDSCSDQGFVCAPTPLANGSYQPQPCDSWGGGEGRCLPACLPDVQAQRDRLTRGPCDQGELCVPCYDPVSGDSTGACELEDDAPTDPSPYEFPTCCDDGAGNDLGSCVPGALVPAAQQSLLGPDNCQDQGFLCAPTEVAADAYVPEECASWLDAEGRCLPACLPPVAAQVDRLQRDLCGQGELCVPCYDPVSGDSTGACEIAPDAPVDDPVTFPTCCDTGGEERGTCVPRQAAGAQGDILPVLDCETQTGDADQYVCAPNEKVADPDYQFPSCNTTCGSDLVTCALGAIAGVFGAPGACVPACMLSETQTPIGGTAAGLYGQSTCDAGEDCGPCDDPTTGEPTGLCE